MKEKWIMIFIIILCLFLISCKKNIVIPDNTDPHNHEIDDIDPKDNDPEDVDPNENTQDDEVYEYEMCYANYVDSDYLYSQVRMFVKDAEIPVYNCKVNFAHTWNPDAPQRMNNGVAIIGLNGTVKLRLELVFNPNDRCVIRPLEKNITPKIDNEKRIIEFVISEAGQYTIELSNDRTIHLFVNQLNQYFEYKDIENIIYFGPGVHNKSNSEHINSSNMINLSSNTIVFIDYGAIVEAGFIANNKENITIVGNGIVSGAPFSRSASTNSKLIPYEFNYCKNLKFYGISTLDPAGWCYNLYFCENVELDNIKIISSRSNGDGVSIQSCKHVKCTNSFVRSWDDSLVVKNYPQWSNRSLEGTTQDILFDNCIIWTDLAQSMEVGYETVGEVMEDITFSNITVLHNFHKAPISIHNANNAHLKNVTFKNIIVEDAKMGKGDGHNILIEITAEFSSTWSNGHKVTSLGSVDGVLIENVKVYNATNPEISIRGSIDTRSQYDGSIHYVSNVTIKDLYINGQKITSDYNNLEIVYAQNVSIE